MQGAEKLHVLVTGTQGRVGGAIMPGLRRTFNVTEFDIAFPEDGDPSQLHGDIAEHDVIMNAVRTTSPNCIVHLAANANHRASAEEVQAPNFTGLRNVYEAAAQCHVPKIVFASSVHTHSAHPGFPNISSHEDARKIAPDDPYNPGNPYGESKVWGEKLAQYYGDEYGLRTVALRLGDLNAANKPGRGPHVRFAPIWLSHPDATHVFTKAILVDPPKLVSAYFAMSDNDGPYDIQPTMDALGYQPIDGIAKRR